MRRALENLIKQLLRVPPEPQAPRGAPGSMQVFRAAPGFFRYRLLGWGISQAGALLGLIASVIFLQTFATGFWGRGFWLLEAIGIAFFLIQLPISFLLIALDYEYRWYMVTDRSLRIREGINKVQEKTMTFSNIQNVSIRQGPLQRLFGISDVEVRTAGGGDASPGGNQHQGIADNLHLGYFRGVDNAGEIRDAILAHLKRLRSAGLGDPDEPMTKEAATVAPANEASAGEEELLDAGRRVLDEVRALRRAMG